MAILSRCSPLHNAAGRGYLDIVELLVEAGADINTRWREGEGGFNVKHQSL